MEIKKIIVQAGGKGTRLEMLTKNKPKCLVPVNNKPILFYTLHQFPQAEFIIIGDYKADVLKKYLGAFAKDYKYTVVTTDKAGTASGMKEALSYIGEKEPFLIMWSDLILSPGFTFPEEAANYIGISKEFECRYSFANGKITKEPSKEHGIAGLFIFKDKAQLEGIPEEGAFVRWLGTKNLQFEELPLFGSKEIGTMISYSENNDDSNRCRPFNKMVFDGDYVTKTAITEQGKKIACDEIAWYKKVSDLGYKYIPEIYSYEPLRMKRIAGKNIFEYQGLDRARKKEIMERLICALKELHKLEKPLPANDADLFDNYITKTWDRLEPVKNMIPFADKEFITINGREYKNVFFFKEVLESKIKACFPKEFKLIHGDPTFSNLMLYSESMEPVLIDPRGYFGKTKYYGDPDYDWGKLYYSIKGNYDQFNRKKFDLTINEKDVTLVINSNNWEDMDDIFFKLLPDVDKFKIKILHAVIWLSLTTYAWEDYDSVCGAFYNGIIHLNEVI